MRQGVMLLPPERVLCKALIDNPPVGRRGLVRVGRKKGGIPRHIEIVPLEVSKMNRLTRLTRFVAAAAVVAVFAAPSVVQADNQDDIAYRQAIMKTIGAQAASINMIIQGKAPAANIAGHAQIMALATDAALDAFTPKVPGGTAKADVWAKWDDFSKQMKDFQTAVHDFSKAAQSGGVEAAKAKMQATFGSCRSCHDAYREKK